MFCWPSVLSAEDGQKPGEVSGLTLKRLMVSRLNWCHTPDCHTLLASEIPVEGTLLRHIAIDV